MFVLLAHCWVWVSNYVQLFWFVEQSTGSQWILVLKTHQIFCLWTFRIILNVFWYQQKTTIFLFFSSFGLYKSNETCEKLYLFCFVPSLVIWLDIGGNRWQRENTRNTSNPSRYIWKNFLKQLCPDDFPSTLLLKERMRIWENLETVWARRLGGKKAVKYTFLYIYLKPACKPSIALMNGTKLARNDEV